MQKLILAFLLICGSSLLAQKVDVVENNRNLGGGNHEALVVNIFDVSKEDVEKKWKSELKSMNAKVSTDKDGNLFGDNAVIKDLGNNTMDIYCKITVLKDGAVELAVAVDLGGAFMNSKQHAKEVALFKKKLKDFSVQLTGEAIAAKLKEQKNKLEDLQDEQNKLVKEKQSLDSDIEKYKQKIKDAEANLEKNKQNQEKKVKELEEQKKVVDAIDKKYQQVGK